MGLSYARSPAGEAIAECELEPGDIGLLAALSQEAKRHGASYLCVYCTADLTGAGFERRLGYRRFTASHALAAKPLPVLDAAAVREVWPRSFIGQWGHHQIEPADFEAFADSVFVGLRRGGSWAGICRVEPDHRHIDGPGFAGWPGNGDAVKQLVAGASALLRPGLVTLETWGDQAEPYLELGFEIAAECPGWELALA